MTKLIHSHIQWRDFPLCIAGDECGVRALLLGSDEETRRELETRFPSASYKIGQLPVFDAAIAHLDDPECPPPPIAPMGTDFQRIVWAALCGIPRAKTTDYATLAASIGRPKAARAVAAACAANPIALLIPCHRVIRRDGTLSGYRWGVEMKARLLEFERGCKIAIHQAEPRPPILILTNEPTCRFVGAIVKSRFARPSCVHPPSF